MISFRHIIVNPVGLHARPAKQLAKMVKERNYQIDITYNGRTVKADRMLQVVSLGAVTGAAINVEIYGNPTDEDVLFIRRFFNEQV